VGIGAHIDRPYLVAALEQVSRWQNLRSLQSLDYIDHDNGPAIVLELQWDLGYEAIRGIEVLEQVGDGEADTVGPLC